MNTKDNNQLNILTNKRNTGITLIALVISIIVLLILSAVSINAAIGDNGIITKAMISKEEKDKSDAEFEITSAISSLKYYEFINSEYGKNLKKIYSISNLQKYVNGRINGVRVNPLTGEKQIWYTNTSGQSYTFLIDQTGHTEIHEGLYISSENSNTTLYAEAGDSFTLSADLDIVTWEFDGNGEDYDYSDYIEINQDGNVNKINDAEGKEVRIKGTSIDGQTVHVTIGTRIVPNPEDIPQEAIIEEKIEEEIEAGEYLADVVTIGDYVDIGIEYDDMTERDGTAKYYVDAFIDGSITNNAPLNGWRVIDVRGSGASGVIKVVSAGSALSFYHIDGYSNLSLRMLSDLNTTITIVPPGGTGFRKNNLKKDGVINNNLNEVFSSSPYVDITQGVHALMAGSNFEGTKRNAALSELESIYEKITGQYKPMNQLYREGSAGRFYQNFSTKELRQVVLASGRDWKYEWNDLLTNGQYYWLGGIENTEGRIWNVDGYGGIYYVTRDAFGVRPVVCLKPGIKVSSSNRGNGDRYSAAYKLE